MRGGGLLMEHVHNIMMDDPTHKAYERGLLGEVPQN